jgi:hypothetical protein
MRAIRRHVPRSATRLRRPTSAGIPAIDSVRTPTGSAQQRHIPPLYQRDSSAHRGCSVSQRIDVGPRRPEAPAPLPPAPTGTPPRRLEVSHPEPGASRRPVRKEHSGGGESPRRHLFGLAGLRYEVRSAATSGGRSFALSRVNVSPAAARTWAGVVAKAAGSHHRLLPPASFSPPPG